MSALSPLKSQTTQPGDIAKAKTYWQDYKRRKKEDAGHAPHP